MIFFLAVFGVSWFQQDLCWLLLSTLLLYMILVSKIYSFNPYFFRALLSSIHSDVAHLYFCDFPIFKFTSQTLFRYVSSETCSSSGISFHMNCFILPSLSKSDNSVIHSYTPIFRSLHKFGPVVLPMDISLESSPLHLHLTYHILIKTLILS